MKIFFTLLLLSSLTHAMKPAPAVERKLSDFKTGYTLISTPKDEYGSVGVTKLLTKKGKTLWTLKEYIGARDVFTSPDGKTLVLWGNSSFGGMIQPSNQSITMVVFKNAQMIKSVTLKELLGTDPETLVAELKTPVFGGNWASLDAFATDFKVDWKSRTAQVNLYNGTTKSIRF